MTNYNRILTFIVVFLMEVAAMATPIYRTRDFVSPPMKWRPVPLWFWNNTQIEADELVGQLERMLTIDGYGGCAILPFGESFSPDYISEDYFALYEKAIEVIRKYGASMSLYDEYGFPSGSMGAINGCGIPAFKNRHPGHCIKRLDKTERELENGRIASFENIYSGALMAVVAFDKKNKAVVNLREFVKSDGSLEWNVPDEGNWTLMIFECVADDDPNVDYLSAEAVKLFVEDTHQQYYYRFGNAFGSEIKTTFFDEPTMYRAEGRMWTPDFNKKFEDIYGFSPESLYPALWYDIGEKTPMARNMLFGTRARLYAEGFMKTIADWAENHGILSTGHQDQEEVANPCGVAGDLMLACKYMSMPGIDKIGGDRPAERFYKVISSAANNWDRSLVMSETFGAMGNLSMADLYRIATEQYSKGINHLIPHAVWYDDNDVTFLPELSSRNPLYKDSLPGFNRFLSRLNYVLGREGRHVADVAMLYPITTLQSGHFFDGPLGAYAGGVSVPNTDYFAVSQILTDDLGIDFTYLHPEVLEDKCFVENSRLVMRNPVNTEAFSVLILPGCRSLTTGTLKKIEEAARNGVRIIFTSRIPSESADDGYSHSDVSRIVGAMIASGDAILIEEPSAETFGKVFENEDLDVKFETAGKPFNYIHKVIDGGNVYYWGNITSQPSSCRITLNNGLKDCTLLYPRTGRIVPASLSRDGNKSHIDLTLQPEESVFLIENSLIDASD